MNFLDIFKIFLKGNKTLKDIKNINKIKTEGFKSIIEKNDPFAAIPKKNKGFFDNIKSIFNIKKREDIELKDNVILTKQDQKEYDKLQNKANRKIDNEYNKLTKKTQDYISKSNLADKENFPVEKIKTKNQYEEQIKKFNDIINSDNLFKERDEDDIEHFKNAFGKSKYAELEGGDLYRDFMDEIENSDSITRFDFFAENMPRLREYYEDANVESDAYDEERLKRRLKELTFELKKSRELSKFRDAAISIKNSKSKTLLALLAGYKIGHKR